MRRDYNQKVMEVIIDTVFNLCEATGNEEQGAEFLALIGQLQAESKVDGRSSAWTPERRAVFGARISAHWAAKRESKGLPRGQVFYRYQYRDESPRNEVADETGLAPNTVKQKLFLNPEGFIRQVGQHRVVYTTSPEFLEDLLRAKFNVTSNSDDIITLPSKKSAKSGI